MDKELMKKYNEASELFQVGRLQKSLEICEKELSKNVRATNLLNLKGLILYIQGNIKESETVWKISKNFNNDPIASTYLKGLEKDKERLKKFNEAKERISNFKVDEAIVLLKECKDSNFNSINVNKELALCYLKKGNFEVAEDYLEEVKKIDRENKEIKIIQKQIDEYEDKSNKTSKIVMGAVTAAIVVGVTIIGGQLVKENNNEVVDKKPETNISINENEIKDNNKEEDNKEVVEKELENRNYSAEDIKNIYDEAVEFFYDEDYEKSTSLLKNIHNIDKKHYLNNHITYFIAMGNYNLKNIDESKKYFDEYINHSNDESYIEEAYYKMALIYEKEDIIKSKNYAYELAYNYPESIYNNDNIDKILSE